MTTKNHRDIKITAIVPALNEGRCITDCLEALHAQDEPLDEVVLVDGGSTDATLGMAAGMADKVIRMQPGRAAQMNAGAGAAAGEVLWFVHADTVVPAAAARRIRRVVHGGSLWGRFDITLTGRRFIFRLVERAINWRSRMAGIATGDQAIFVQRVQFHQVNGFPQIALMEDIALSRALKALGRPASLRPPVLTSSRRWETLGVWRTILLMWRLRFAYWLGKDPEALAWRYGRGKR